MNRRIRLECLECGCAMEFSSECFMVANSIKCPGCKNMLYRDGFRQFENALMRGDDLPQKLPGLEREFLNETKGFSATIQNSI